MTTPTIEFDTPRLSLRAWQDRHRAPFARMNADPEVRRYFPSILTEEQSNASVDFWLQHFSEKGWGNWAVELRRTREFIGFIGLWVPKQRLPFGDCVEIGWRLKRDAWGCGYATEGAAECLRVGFNQLELEEIVSFTTVTNLPSVAVMKRIGMTEHGEPFEHPGVPEGSPLRPHRLFKITRAQWLAR